MDLVDLQAIAINIVKRIASYIFVWEFAFLVFEGVFFDKAHGPESLSRQAREEGSLFFSHLIIFQLFTLISLLIRLMRTTSGRMHAFQPCA